MYTATAERVKPRALRDTADSCEARRRTCKLGRNEDTALRTAFTTHLPAAALAALTLAFPAEAQAPGAPRFHLSLGYDGRLLFKVLDIQVEQAADEAAFSSSAQLRSSGILALFKKVDLRASAQGHVVRGDAEPGVFHYQNIDGKTNRKLEVTWADGEVATVAQPPYKPTQLGDPPASPEQKLESVDPITGLMRITLGDSQGEFCHGALKFFDGKQRYNLEFLDRRVMKPSAREIRLGLVNPVSCNVRFREVAGFHAKKRASEQNQGLQRPIVIGFAEVGRGGPWVISYLDADTPLGHADIDLQRIRTIGAAPQ